MKLYELKNYRPLTYPVGKDIKSLNIFINSVIDKIIEEELLSNVQEITVWCRGSSGAMLASLFSVKLIEKRNVDIKINHIKKPREYAHHSNLSENTFSTYNIVIDDLVASGSTLKFLEEHFRKIKLPQIDMLILGSINYDLENDVWNSEKNYYDFSNITFRHFIPEIILVGSMFRLNPDKFNEYVKNLPTTKFN